MSCWWSREGQWWVIWQSLLPCVPLYTTWQVLLSVGDDGAHDVKNLSTLPTGFVRGTAQPSVLSTAYVYPSVCV